MNRDENILRGIIEKLKIDTSPDPLHKESLGEKMLSVFAERQKGKQRLYRTIKLPVVKMAAAAIVLIAFILLLNISTPKVIALEQLYDAIDKVDNICKEKFTVSAKEPYQTVWTSRSLNVKFYNSTRYDPPRLTSETGEAIEPGKAIRKFVLFDIDNLTITIKDLDTSTTTSKPFNEKQLAKIHKMMALPTIIPFTKLENIPDNATWHKIEDSDVSSQVSGTEAYDLTWKIDIGDNEKFWLRRTWRFFIDPSTNLPKRLETYTSDHVRPEPKLGTISIYSHPSDEEVLAMIEEMFN